MLEVRGHRSMPALLVVIASFALLALLATLQYHWLGQLSSGERERMRSALKTSVAHFCEDFDREVARAWVALRMDSATLRRRAWNQFGERYTRWAKQSPYPRLVNALYLVSENNLGLLQVMQFNPAAKTFESTDLPADLELVRQKIGEQQRNVQFEGGFRPPLLFPQVVGRVPLLIIPVIPLPEEIVPGQRHFGVKVMEADLQSVIVARLDSDYIQREFLPALAKRYFSSDSASDDNGRELDYQLSIISQTDPAKVIYSTVSKPPMGLDVDASGTLLTLQPHLVEDFSFQVSMPMIAVSAGRPSVGVVGTAQPEAIFSTALTASPPLAEFGSWQLLVKHRAGSVDEAVEKLRRQNLFISFSILLLLAASGALIYVSALRSRRLAHQQIEFVAGVSHELRIPVSVVCLTSANLADGLIREPQQVEQYGHLIHDAGRRLAQSIEQILDFAGAEMVRRPYQFGEVDIEQLIASVLDASRPDWQAAGFTIKEALEKPLPAVKGDRAALGRALQNLISNAVKYSGESRLIEVNAQIGRTQRQTRVQITVVDHGIGIEQGERDSIFEPFRRGTSAVAAQIPGNGLGLYLVRRTLAAHGGEVTVQSAPATGSAFTLHLPALESHALQEDQREI